MITDTDVRTFDTPDVDGVAAVTIHLQDSKDAKPFRATQFFHKRTFDDGRKWLQEPDDYIQTDEYRRAVAEHTHIPIGDIRLKAHPVAAYGVI